MMNTRLVAMLSVVLLGLLAGCTASEDTTPTPTPTVVAPSSPEEEPTPSSTAIPIGLATSIAPTRATLAIGKPGTADRLTMTVLTVQKRPHGEQTQREVESYAVQVKACASKTAADIFLDRWWLVSTDGHSYMADASFYSAPTSDTQSATPDPTPNLGFPQTAVPPGSCQTGWFNVNVPDGTTAAYVLYQSPDGTTALWKT